MIRKALALAILVALPSFAWADEPGSGNYSRRAVKSRTVHTATAYPLLAPYCLETFNSTLLKCAPRVVVPVDDISTLNQLNAVPSRVRTPYPSLFMWD